MSRGANRHNQPCWLAAACETCSSFSSQPCGGGQPKHNRLLSEGERGAGEGRGKPCQESMSIVGLRTEISKGAGPKGEEGGGAQKV